MALPLVNYREMVEVGWSKLDSISMSAAYNLLKQVFIVDNTIACNSNCCFINSSLYLCGLNGMICSADILLLSIW